MFVPILGALFVSYFLVHAVQGNRGVLAWIHLQKQVTLAEHTMNETKSVLIGYERWISLLRSEQLDADMLDERARIMAGLMHPSEFIVVDSEAVENR